MNSESHRKLNVLLIPREGENGGVFLFSTLQFDDFFSMKIKIQRKKQILCLRQCVGG